MDERIEAMIQDPNSYPEWLADAADKTWEELTDEQRQFFENYRAYLDEVHEELAVKPRDTGRLVIDKVKTLTDALHAQEPKAKEIVHFMSFDSHGSKGPGVYCSCGMYKTHKRGKVLAAWADKHFEKYGHYWKRS